MRRDLAMVLGGFLLVCGLPALPVLAQEKSVRPGINDPFKKPDLKTYLGKFEVESREVYSDRDKIVEAVGLKPGMAVADVGSGTGLFTRLFAKKVGPKGKVYAVDIAEPFLEHVRTTAKAEGIGNVTTIRCDQFSTKLPPGSVDLVYVCDTYHHFEFPFRTLQSIHEALKPGGQLVVIDFHRIKGKSRPFILQHVRAGQEVFTREISQSGFRQVEEKKFLEENYFLRFVKVERKTK